MDIRRHHPATLLAMNNLAAILHDGGRPHEAEPLLLRILEARREVLPDESIEIAYTQYVRTTAPANDAEQP